MAKDEILFVCKYFTIFKRMVRLPTGKMYPLYGMNRSDGAVIVPLHKGKLVMLRHYRAGIDGWDYEVPMGFINKGEDPKKAAIRELEEETGYKAKKVRYLFSSFLSPAFTKQRGYFYLAECGSRTDHGNPDKTEVAEVVLMSLPKAMEMIKRNKIRGATTIQAILFYDKYAKSARA